MTPRPILSPTRNEPEACGSVMQLHTLGDAVVTVGTREIRPTSPTVFAALVYLGVERGQRVPRAALQELLFPDADERSGAHNLRQLLYKLRQLGAPIKTEGDVIWVDPDQVTDDYSASAVDGNGTATSGSHRTARFLAGYAPRLSPAFDEWLEARRATVGAAVRRDLVARMATRRNAADWASVERIAQEILEADPFNEEATLALAEATALSGSKSEAVRILERYEYETGRSDLKLPAAVLRKRISERLPERRRRALDTPFVGRDAEAEAMRQAVLQLRGGVPGSIAIVGEPGIGKTRLAEETTALALLEGVNVQVVRCQPHYTMRPMGVFIELVPPLLASRGGLGVSPESLQHLNLLTSHRDDRPNRPVDARDDATRSGVVLAAIRDLVDAVASESPILVVVEDAHWADAASLRELSALAAAARGRALLVVYTARRLEPLRDAGAIGDAIPVLRLKPLVEDSMATLARHLLPETVAVATGAQEAMHWCVRTAAGNPFYLQVLCAHYEDTRQPFTVPPSMRSATIRRIELLPPDCRRLLELCALMGRHATLDSLRTLLEIQPLPFLNAIQRLEEEGYLRTAGNAARTAHDLLADCVLELLPPLSQKVLHASVAANLEKRYDATRDATLLWDCAEHWTASGEPTRAVHLVIRCGRHASDIGRSDYAVDLLNRGRRYAANDSDLALLLEAASLAATAASRWKVVLEVEERLALLPSATSPGEVHTDTELRSIQARWALNYDSANSITPLLGCTRATNASSPHRTDAALLLVRIAIEHGDQHLADEAFHNVQDLLHEDSIISSNRQLPLIYHTNCGDRDLALRLARRLRGDLPSLEMTHRFRSARNVGLAFCFLGEATEGIRLFQEYFAVATRLGLADLQYDFAANCTCAYVNEEDWPAAEQWYERAAALRTPTKAVPVDSGHIVSGIELAIHYGDRLRAQLLLDEASQLINVESRRGRAHLFGIRVRIRQLDPEFVCDRETREEMRRMYEATKALTCADSLVSAICEDLSRETQSREISRILGDYLITARRERSRLPSRLGELARQAGLS